MRKHLRTGGIAFAVLFGIPTLAQTPATQLQIEKKFDALIDAKHIGENIKLFSAKPHAIGSPQGKLVRSLPGRKSEPGADV